MANYIVANLTSTPALSAEGGGRDIAIDRDGKLWVVYSKKPAGVNYHQIFATYSTDNGQTWQQDDLSPDVGVQTGEYIVRLGPPSDPNAVARPEDYMGKLHVRPAKDVRVVVRAARPLPARLLTPEGAEATITPMMENGYAVYRVPEVPIYAVNVLPN